MRPEIRRFKPDQPRICNRLPVWRGRGNELSMLTPIGLPAMLAEGRAFTNFTAYRCERHAYCSVRPRRRLSAGDEQHRGVRAGACAGSRKLGSCGAVM